MCDTDDSTYDVFVTLVTPCRCTCDVMAITRKPVWCCRVLWVDWQDGYVRIGYGHTVGVDEFFSKYFSSTAINAVRYVSVGHVSPDTSYAYFTYRYTQGDLLLHVPLHTR